MSGCSGIFSFVVSMKVLLLHQYFKTPEEGGCIRSYYLATGLVQHGYQVEVVTAYNGKDPLTKMLEGMLVHYLPVYYDNHLKPWQRLISFAKFAFLAIFKARKLNDIDVCYALSTPLSIGLVALYLKRFRGLPYIFEVGDLWPAAPIQMGLIKNIWLVKWFYRFEKLVYEKADQLVALSPPIRQSMIETVPGQKVTLIPNMSDCDFFELTTKRPLLETKYDVKDRFVVTYFGAAGKANHLEFLLEAAEANQLRHANVIFLALAYGSELDRIKLLSKEKGLKNLRFLDYRSKMGLKEVLEITDAVYISYADYPILQTGSPNRFFDAAAAGKLILLNFGGWLREIVESRKCGLFTDPLRSHTLTDQLQPFLEDPQLLSIYQSNARKAAEEMFSRKKQIQKLVTLLGHKSDEISALESAHVESAEVA